MSRRLDIATREVLRVLRRYLSPHLATRAVSDLEAVAGPPADTVEVSELDRARAEKAMRAAGIHRRVPGTRKR